MHAERRFIGAIADSGNDTGRDGVGNPFEFGFGLNPTLQSAAQLPRPQKVGGNFVTSFTQPNGVSGITYGAEWSTTRLAAEPKERRSCHRRTKTLNWRGTSVVARWPAVARYEVRSPRAAALPRWRAPPAQRVWCGDGKIAPP